MKDSRAPRHSLNKRGPAITGGSGSGSGSGGDSGSVTAEFATVMPAVIVILVLCLAGVQVTGQQVRVQDGAADAARLLGRGESVAAAKEFVATALPGANLTAESRGGAVCVSLRMPTAVPGASVLKLTLKASSCALSGGR